MTDAITPEVQPVETYADLMAQLEEIHKKIEEQIKFKTGSPAARQQMQMAAKLLGEIKAGSRGDGSEIPMTGSFEGFKELCQTFGITSQKLLEYASEIATAMKSEVVTFSGNDLPGNVIEFEAEIKPGESIVKPARLFYVGNHKGRDYTKEDLQRIVENFNPDEGVPLQLDHSKSARDTIGFPQKLWLSNEGTEIHGDLEFRGKENVEKVRLGLWKKLSIGLGIKHPDMKMDHVAVTPFPSLADAAMFDSLTPEASDNKNQKGGIITMSDQVQTVTMTEFEAMKTEFARLEKEKGELEE